MTAKANLIRFAHAHGLSTGELMDLANSLIDTPYQEILDAINEMPVKPDDKTIDRMNDYEKARHYEAFINSVLGDLNSPQ